MSEAEPAAPMSLDRARRWVAVSLALGLLLYVGYAVVRGLNETATELARFDWLLYVGVLGLTLLNYGLRYVKWHFLLGRVGVQIAHRDNLRIFTAGLAMVISPAKAGELLKPWLVREATGTPMVRTIPALVTERVTDGIAVVVLAAVGVSTFYAEGTRIIGLTLTVIAAGFAVIAVESLSVGIIRGIGRIGPLHGISDRLEEMYRALRSCVSPGALAFTTVLSLAAWWAECVGFWLVFKGLGFDAPLDAATFIYAFGTVFGAPSPGGMGMADGAIAEISLQLLHGLTGGQAVAATLLIRVATLWFGVLLGAGALFGIEGIVGRHAALQDGETLEA